jgi:hypothetical protein
MRIVSDTRLKTSGGLILTDHKLLETEVLGVVTDKHNGTATRKTTPPAGRS